MPLPIGGSYYGVTLVISIVVYTSDTELIEIPTHTFIASCTGARGP
jgi:hypothetical protein